MPKKHQPIGVGMTPSRTELGKFLRARRIEIGLPQIQVAKLSGIRQSVYTRFEIGIQRYLKPRQLEGLAKALKCDPSQLEVLTSKMRQAEPKTDLGRFIRSRREQLGLTLEDFAKKLKVAPLRTRSLEVGKSSSIQYCLLNPLAKALNLEPLALSKFVGTRTKPTNSALGQLVRTRRKELYLNQDQLSKKLGVNRQFVSQIELGQCRLSESDGMIERLAEVLKLEVAELQAVRPQRRLKQKMTEPAILGAFLAARRLKLNLLQKEVAQRAQMATSIVCGIETGRYRPGRTSLEKLSKALECQIPIEFLSQNQQHDLRKIKELSDLRGNSEAIRKALKILRRLLERQQDGYVVFLIKGDERV